MDIYANIPPLFEPGQDLYESLQPADALDWLDGDVSRYNPHKLDRAVCLLGRAVSLLQGIRDDCCATTEAD